MDIIIQGGIYRGTVETAKSYLKLDFVENVIISTWVNEKIPDTIQDRILVIKSEKPEIVGNITMNLQIVSSREGIKRSNSDIVAKTRSDQRISLDSMAKINAFFDKNKNSVSKRFIEGPGPQGPLCVLGISSPYAFHPQDHLFWGFKTDVEKIFDIPLMPMELHSYDWTTAYRFPIYLGANYAARFDASIENYLKNYKEYLSSTGEVTSKRAEALAVSKGIMDDIFKALPEIDMYWEKYNSGYWYKQYKSGGEYYGNGW